MSDAASPAHPRRFPVSWEQFHRDCRALAWRLSESAPFSALITVTRGGLVPAAIVARELDIRIIETICVASYTENHSAGTVRLLKPVADHFIADDGAGLLVVDDLVDTGQTARLLRSVLPKAHFAAVYAKPLGRGLVNTFITEVSQDTWIYFPWDLGLAFQNPISAERG